MFPDIRTRSTFDLIVCSLRLRSVLAFSKNCWQCMPSFPVMILYTSIMSPLFLRCSPEVSRSFLIQLSYDTLKSCNLVGCAPLTFSRHWISFNRYGYNVWMQYSMCRRKYILYSKRRSSLPRFLKCLSIIPITDITLTAALLPSYIGYYNSKISFFVGNFQLFTDTILLSRSI